MPGTTPLAPACSSPLRVLIVDDHDLARAGLRALLATEPGIIVVGEAGDGVQALEACHSERPDVVLLDVRMPGMDGLATARALKLAHPRIQVLMVSLHANPEYVLEAFQAGAAGYVFKHASRSELVEAIHRAGRGESLLTQALFIQTLEQLGTIPALAPATLADRLTPRELEVLRLLAQGRTNRQIGQCLGISPGTAKNHVERILTKLGVSDRTQAAARAAEWGLLR